MFSAFISSSSNFFLVDVYKAPFCFILLNGTLHYFKDNTIKLKTIPFFDVNNIALAYVFLVYLLLIPISSN